MIKAAGSFIATATVLLDLPATELTVSDGPTLVATYRSIINRIRQLDETPDEQESRLYPGLDILNHRVDRVLAEQWETLVGEAITDGNTRSH